MNTFKVQEVESMRLGVKVVVVNINFIFCETKGSVILHKDPLRLKCLSNTVSYHNFNLKMRYIILLEIKIIYNLLLMIISFSQR